MKAWHLILALIAVCIGGNRGEILPAGISFRIHQQSIYQFKQAMKDFLPQVIKFDVGLPHSYEYKINALLGLVRFDFEWTDITYDVPVLDIDDTKIYILEYNGHKMVQIHFEAFKEWRIHANQHLTTLFELEDSFVYFEFKDFKLMLGFNFHLTPQHTLRPVVYDSNMKFGESFLHHDNVFCEIIFHQLIKFGLVVIQNSVYFAGDYIFSDMFEPILTSALNEYRQPFRLINPFNGQTLSDSFEIDWHPTQEPWFGHDYIDFHVLGQTIYNNQSCEPFKKEDTFLMNVEDKSQIAISDEAFTCMLNQWSRSNIGFIYLNQNKFNRLFRSEITLDTTYLKNGLGISYFFNKFGPNMPVILILSFKDITAYFGEGGVDLLLEYTVIVSVNLQHNKKFHTVRDEFRLITAMDISNTKDVLHMKIRQHKQDMDPKYTSRYKPIFSSFEITRNEYIEF